MVFALDCESRIIEASKIDRMNTRIKEFIIFAFLSISKSSSLSKTIIPGVYITFGNFVFLDGSESKKADFLNGVQF